IDGAGGVLSTEQLGLYARTYPQILRTMVQEPHAQPDFAFLAAEPALAATALHPTVVARFTRQVIRTPNATALVMGEERWSYARLGQAADTVARNLHALGAPPQARIGIAMD